MRTIHVTPLWESNIIGTSLKEAFKKLKPTTLVKNPVIFIVEVGSVMTTLLFFHDIIRGDKLAALFSGQISLWLWITVLSATFAESIAEGRGKAQAESLKRARSEMMASVRSENGDFSKVSSSNLRKNDVLVVTAGDIIPADGTVIEGAATVDESAITGESAPVVREAGGDRSAVTGGTMVLSDRLVIRITANPGESFLDRMIALVEGAVRQKTPNEISLNILLCGLTIVFLLTVLTVKPFALYAGAAVSPVVLVALLVCLIPTTIGGLLSAIGIAGMDRLVQRNVLAMSGRAVEAAGDVDVLILDKTGTITMGNRMATDFVPVGETDLRELAEAALLSSLADLTPEGRSIVALAKQHGVDTPIPPGSEIAPFSAETRMSGIDFAGISIRKGAGLAIQHWLQEQKQIYPPSVSTVTDRIAISGGTPLIVAKRDRVLGVIHLKDVVKPGIRDRLERLRAMGIKTIMVTGDNQLTAKAIATEAGVDDFLAEAKPEDKLRLIKEYQTQGRMVAMSGDGTNDAPALAQSDVGLVMNTGTQAAREAGNMVDLDSDPTKLIEIVEIGKQLLITRGSLTTFSIANDVSKYFAIIPALFTATMPGVATLNIMRLTSPQSAILSAVIFNAVVILLLVPLALRGVMYRPQSAASILKRNFLIYGVGGLVLPFIGIKAIDWIITVFSLV